MFIAKEGFVFLVLNRLGLDTLVFLFFFCLQEHLVFKVIVQFEIEGNDQSEIASLDC